MKFFEPLSVETIGLLKISAENPIAQAVKCVWRNFGEAFNEYSALVIVVIGKKKSWE